MNTDLTSQTAIIDPAPQTRVRPDIIGERVTVVDNGQSYFPTIRHRDGTTGRIHRGNLRIVP